MEQAKDNFYMPNEKQLTNIKSSSTKFNDKISQTDMKHYQELLWIKDSSWKIDITIKELNFKEKMV